MSNGFKFKQFTILHEKNVMKVGTDGVLLGAWVDVRRVRRILDIGTGTGIIAIMLAQKNNALIDAIENDEKSFIEAETNIKNCPWNSRIKLYLFSFQDFSRKHSFTYDLIVSNPPFFNYSFKPQSVQQLKAKHTDNLTYKELIAGVSLLISENGRFAVILPYLEGQQFIEIAKEKDLLCSRITYVKPKTSKKENRLLLEFQKKQTELKSEVLIIRNEDNSYTEVYKKLTKEYYLEF